MKTVTFDESKLLGVSRDGLEYLDDQGCRCAIDFHMCRENVQEELRSGRWQPKPAPDSLTWHVGFRDVDGSPPNITLATNPPTRFIFPKPSPSADFLRSDFQQFQVRLFEEAGVTTLDMS